MPTPSRWTSRFAAPALAAAISLGATASDAPQFAAYAAPDAPAVSPAQWRKSRDEVIAKLLQFAKTCKSKGCIRESRAAYERVVALDPEHTEARHSLGHEKKEGRWYVAAAPKMPDSPAKLVDEIEAQRKAVVGPFVEKALAVALDAAAPAEVREQAAADASSADPANPDARKANREVDDNGVWRLEETVAARARRAEVTEVFRKRYEETKAIVPEPASEADVAVVGAGGVQAESHFGRVVGSAQNPEVAGVAQLQPGLEALFRAAISEPRSLRRMKVVLFPDPASGIAAVQRDAKFDAAAKQAAESLGATWAPGTLEYWIYGQTPEGRSETAMRGAVGTWLFWGWRIDAKRGWALEGVNHWFSEATLGSHRVAYLRPSEYAGSPLVSALTDQLRQDGADWMTIASEMAQSDLWPGVRSILAKDVNTLGPEGLLLSYVLARYVIESKPRVIGDVFTAVANTEQPDAWMSRLLGATPEGLDRRLRRWTAEVAAAGPSKPAVAAPTPPAAPPAKPGDGKTPPAKPGDGKAPPAK